MTINQLVQQITQLSEQRQALRLDYSPETYATKRTKIAELDIQIASLYAQKREMQAARRNRT